MIDVFWIIKKYYDKKSLTYDVLVKHSSFVVKKALEIVELNQFKNIDIEFIKEAGMLHDIGIIKTYAPEIWCFWSEPYLCHWILWAKILKYEWLLKHALVCERHTWVWITKEEIIENKLPLPYKDFVPKTLEEKIICVADKFYSKDKNISKEKTIDEILLWLSRFWNKKVDIFLSLCKEFNIYV